MIGKPFSCEIRHSAIPSSDLARTTVYSRPNEREQADLRSPGSGAPPLHLITRLLLIACYGRGGGVGRGLGVGANLGVGVGLGVGVAVTVAVAVGVGVAVGVDVGVGVGLGVTAPGNG